MKQLSAMTIALSEPGFSLRGGGGEPKGPQQIDCAIDLKTSCKFKFVRCPEVYLEILTNIDLEISLAWSISESLSEDNVREIYYTETNTGTQAVMYENDHIARVFKAVQCCSQ